MYPNYLNGLKYHGKAEVNLHKLIEDNSEQDNSPYQRKPFKGYPTTDTSLVS